ncbi:1-phosphofructokinase [Metabacillus arenae]|uniref:Tagatose-6-phosphate kinase n=1 Tax=Metabacillus arenae TaxID=2771434 RepID=A0A926ND72_9BACI|nr:1-phosphofructokinase [Metabacillus arenae]MBD1381329.1 1-phosphofructokinase [Metabacillus arenae]
MIYTVTLNPSVDYIVEVQDFQLGELNRSLDDYKFPGGKGINVSRVLRRFGLPSKALGFVGGFTGQFVKDYLADEEIETDFVKVSDDTRINIKLKTGSETEINGKGPDISKEKLEEFFTVFDQLTNEDIVLLAGSIPTSLPDTFYAEIAEKCGEKGIQVAVDISGEPLKHIVKCKPFLMKPNHHELAEMFNVEINSAQDAVPYGQKLIEAGAEHVIVSMAGDGALLFTKDHQYFANVPKGKVRNSVGAGDSLVAGFIGSYVKGLSIEESFRFGVAAGSATAFSYELCTNDEVEKLLKEVKVKSLEEGF